MSAKMTNLAAAVSTPMASLFHFFVSGDAPPRSMVPQKGIPK